VLVYPIAEYSLSDGYAQLKEGYDKIRGVKNMKVSDGRNDDLNLIFVDGEG